MSENISLTDLALKRLRKLAEGNGISPDSIEVIDKNESVYEIHGTITLVPKFEVQTKSYAGGARGKGRVILRNFAEMQDALNEKKRIFLESGDWTSKAFEDLEKDASHGWGLSGYRIDLEDKNSIFAASENCPTCSGTGLLTCDQCQGRFNVTCPYCQGQGRENCYNCFGRGEDPVNPQQQCPICHGTRFAPCRYCHTTGQLLCPTCQGKGGTTCHDCQGARQITQEITINTYAEIEFQLGSGKELPSGLLRSIDRVGVENMPKGHADIDITETEKNSGNKEKANVYLLAKVPYADVKLRINDKNSVAAVFGKRGKISGIPAFLDDTLQPWRDHLKQAATGKSQLEKALEARLIRDALKLELEGKGRMEELRRLYPVGLSGGAATEIMRHIEMSLKRLTIKARSVIAAIMFFINLGVFAGVFFTPLHLRLAENLQSKLVLGFDVLLPMLTIGLSWFGITNATKWVLQKKYPEAKVKQFSKIGKIGYGALTAITLVYMVIYAIFRSI